MNLTEFKKEVYVVVKYHKSFERDRSGNSKTVVVVHRRRFAAFYRSDNDIRTKATKAAMELSGGNRKVSHVR